MPIVRGWSVAVTLAVLLCAVPRAGEASLIGDSVTCVDLDSITCTSGTATVGPGPEFTLLASGGSFGALSVDIAASTITLRDLDNTFLGTGGGDFATFGDLDSSAGDVVGASVVTSDIFGLDNSSLSITAHSIVIDLTDTA